VPPDKVFVYALKFPEKISGNTVNHTR